MWRILSLLPDSLTEWVALLMTLERLDDAWGIWLRKVSDTSLPLDTRWDVPLEQLLCALLYRHLPGALEDEKLLERARMCLMLTQLVQAMFAASPVHDMDTLVDIVRMMSSTSSSNSSLWSRLSFHWPDTRRISLRPSRPKKSRMTSFLRCQ